jgi:hypothetical protein
MIIPVGFANFVVNYIMAGDTEAMQTSWGVDVSDAGGAYDDVLEYLADSYANAWVAETSDQTTMGPYRLEVGQDGGDPITVEYGATTVGSNNDEPLPPNCALLVRKTSAFGGRRNRGRAYIPGLALKPSSSPAGVLDGAAVTALQGDANDWLAAATNAGPPEVSGLVILHSEAPSTPTEIVGLDVQDKIATQRRRLRP